jgi:NhaA family Na+:H+ antiporter
MSLFIGALAFPADTQAVEAAKIGTLAGSLLSALAGFLLLRRAPAVANDGEQARADEIFSADRAR